MSNSNALLQQINEIEQLLKNNPEQALKKATIANNENPDSENVQLLLARSQRISGQFDDSIEILEKIIIQTPLNIIARMELATVFNQKKQHQKAINLLTETTQLAPEYHEVWEILSQHLYQAGDKDGAQNALNQFNMIKQFNLQLAEANEHFAAGRFAESEQLCRTLLKQIPTEVRTLKLLAQLSSHFSQFEVAVSILEYCVMQQPADILLGVDYANALVKADLFDKAIDECKRVLKLSPDNLSIASTKAQALIKTARYESAFELYNKLLPLHPRKDLCLLRIGNVLKIMGQRDEAIESYKKAIRLNPQLGEAYWNLANLKTYQFASEDMDAISSQLESDNITKENRIFLNFAMGKAKEEAKQFADSFNYYKLANEECSSSKKLPTANRYDKIKSFFTGNYFDHLTGKNSEPAAPIFIVGLRRAGSTLIEQILASHSLVDGTMELTEIPSIIRHLSLSETNLNQHYTKSLSHINQIELDKLAQRYLNNAKNMRSDVPFFTDKLPDNFEHIGLIKSIFPNAKIIDIRREPMACGWSLYKQYFAEGVNYSYDLQAIGQYYNEYVDLMNHWQNVLPGQILSVNYQDLINDFTATVQNILKFCELDFEDSCLNFYENKRAVATISSEQVRQPIYKDGLSQWKNYEEFLTPLKDALNQ